MNTIRLLILSQQFLLRQGIEHLLSEIEDIEIWGSTKVDDDSLMLNIENSPPDVIVLDIDGPNGNAYTLARKLKQLSPSIGIIMLTSNHNDDQLFQALKVQAAAYVDKETETSELVNIIYGVARGEHPINEGLVSRPKVAEQVLSQFQRLSWQNEAESFMSPLTPREIEILKYIAQGFLNKQIALKLGISEQTIKNHVTSILRKLNANARTEAVVLAIKQGLITIN